MPGLYCCVCICVENLYLVEATLLSAAIVNAHAHKVPLHDVIIVSCPDPTPLRGEGSGEIRQHSWATGRNFGAPIRLHQV